MKHSYTQWLGSAAIALAMGLYTPSYAQKVVFPQSQQAGTARAAHDKGIYTLQNDLLTATFKTQGQSLVFGGCPQLNLIEGTELFELQLGESGRTLVKASQLTLVGVEEKTYSADSTQVKGSRKFAGKAIEAKFVHDGLHITWRAVLRDGSHYLRTELELSAPEKSVRTFAIRPMLYKVNVVQAGSAPKVVGNTRGAVLLSDKIFAGVETPTGINSVGEVDQVIFTHGAWTSHSFSWKPTEMPKGLENKGITLDRIVGTKGYLSFKDGGRQTLTFSQQKGAHHLKVLGVELRDAITGDLQASAYHPTQLSTPNVTAQYELNVPKRGVYELRYLVESFGANAQTNGTVSFSGSVAEPVIVADLAPKSTPTVTLVEIAAGTTPGAGNNVLADGGSKSKHYTSTSWRNIAQKDIPRRVGEVGFGHPHVKIMEESFDIRSIGELCVKYQYGQGPNRLNIIGIDLLNQENQVVASDYHIGFTGSKHENNIYKLAVPNAGKFKLRYFVQTKTEPITSSGTITTSLVARDLVRLPSPEVLPIVGTWSRNTTLLKGKTWKIGAVVGIVAPGQARRSFLSYSERERAVPWRAMPAYISWYELNIDRNNDRNYTTNMNIDQCVDVVKQWKANLFDRYGEHVNSFVWDDGWDEYGTWRFNPNFPNGFKEVDDLAKEMGSGQGAWLGPVGGYGQSGNYRRSYWEHNGKMQLSNPAYYQVFTDAIKDLCKGRGYDFRFFKFDGISAQFSSVGPDPGTIGEENAEGIISAEMDVRENIKEDIFFNTTVGTWASPMWFHVTDAIWRQERDHGVVGDQGDDRERWITYRDHLVYKHFVKNSPLCPINTLMTHGVILTKFGDVSKTMDYEGIVREIRCAFACGSGMVELYNDYALMNSINGGRLWGDLAECLRWQRNNADVLPDIHWVGGNPWTGSTAEVYGWAAWNGPKSVLTLRNPAAKPQSYTTTLRKALEIPEHVTGSIILNKAFGNQAALPGLTEDQPINIDTELNLQLPASSVFVFNGREEGQAAVALESVKFRHGNQEVVEGKQKTLVWEFTPVNATYQTVSWETSDPTIATVQNGVVKGIKPGKATITVKAKGEKTAQIELTVLKYIPQPYDISFERTVSPSRTDRFVRSVSLTEQGKDKQTRSIDDRAKKPWQDLTSKSAFEVAPGAIVTPSIDFQGNYMHGYVYIDLNHNNQFDVKQETDEELLSASYIHGKKKELNRLVLNGNKNPGFSPLPSFKAPSTPGTYRLRFKVDWDNINPAGHPGPQNEILSNGGSITDVLLKVVKPSGLETVVNNTDSQPIYDLSGRSTSVTAPGIYIMGDQKIAK